MSPNLKAINKKKNKDKEMPTLRVRACTVLLELYLSPTRKNKPLARLPAIIIIIKMMKSLVIICYTPELANLQKLANLSFE